MNEWTMKPNFALDLSHSSVALLHRTDASKDGWNLIGEVQLDDPEMAARLAMLRKTAAELDQAGMACKLIIPNSEILYTELEAPGTDDIAREVQIRKALVGMTPYDVSELVFDWRRSKGKKVKVAVVARITLQEAEGFARENRMNPVSFVARPQSGFRGEVFFGMASGASALLGPGQTVEPDEKPVPKLRAPKPPEEIVEAPEEAPKEPPAKVDAPRESAPEPAMEEPAPEAEPAPKPKKKKKLPPVPPRRSTPVDIPVSDFAPGPAAGPIPDPVPAPQPQPEPPADIPLARSVPMPEPVPEPMPAQPQAQAPVEPPVQAQTQAQAPAPKPAPTPAPESQPAAQPAPAPVPPRALTPEEEDARIAALLAEVPDPPFASGRKRKADDSEAGEKPAASDAGAQARAKAKPKAKKPKDVPPAPVLAPFPPTLDGEDPIAAKPAKAKPAARATQAKAAAKPAAKSAAKSAPKSSPKPAAPAARQAPPPPRQGTAPGSPAASGPGDTPASRALAAAGAVGPATVQRAGTTTARTPKPAFSSKRKLWKNPIASKALKGLGKSDPAKTGALPQNGSATTPVKANPPAPQSRRGDPGPVPGPQPMTPPSQGSGTAARSTAAPMTDRQMAGRKAAPATPKATPKKPAAEVAAVAQGAFATLTRSARQLLSRAKSGPTTNGAAGAAPAGPPARPTPTGAPRPATGKAANKPPTKAAGGARQPASAPASTAARSPNGKLAQPAAPGTARTAPRNGAAGQPRTAATGAPGAAAKSAQPKSAQARSPAKPAPAKAPAKTPAKSAPAKSTPAKTPAKSAPAARATAIAPAPPKPGTRSGIGTPISASAEEAERLTLFGARKAQKADTENRRVLGMATALGALLILAVIALTYLFFLRGDDTTAAGPDPFGAAAVPDTLTGDEAAGGAVGGDAIGAQTMSDEAAQARYAATGIWEKAPPAPPEPQTDRLDDLYIAAIDPPVNGHDAVALPVPDAEPVPEAPTPPPPPGMRFALDENGMVAPSRRGTLAPEGFKVFSGKPPEVAPARPEPPEGFLPPPPAAPAPDTTGTGAELVQPAAPTPDAPLPELGIQPNEALREFRPVPRPASLIEDNQRANNGGVTLLELAAFQPAPRPELPPVAAESIASAVAAATTAADGEAVAALAASPVPGHRPRNFQTIVESARGSDGSTVVAASAAATTIPTIPTRASVASHATMNNAISLNKVTLIGIYGASSSRRALVRLSDGRYVKVTVGDRLNGGKVVAITDSQVIYSKNGRNYALGLIPL